MTPTATENAIHEASRRLESAGAEEIVAWARDFAGERLVVTSSFSDAVLIDVVSRVAESPRVIFLDTGFHFPETLAYVERVAKRYALRLEVLSAGLDPRESPCGSSQCCQLRKVEPLKAALASERAWVTGIRREETPERAESPIVSVDERYGVVKVNPLATWTHHDVMSYISDKDLPVHPLWYEGYVSIGCAPVTTAVAESDDPRSGRWPGSEKSECGLHA